MSTPRCADASDSRSEPLFATASYVRNWLLVEQPGGWGHRALTQSGFPTGIARALEARARADDVRVILIRRGSRPTGRGRRIYMCHVAPQRSFIESRILEDPEELLRLDLAALVAGETGQGDPVTEPLYLVCTHGRHDACCSIRGNAVSRILCNALGDRAWQASHVGGDRFAANVVCLPHGVYYGRVTPRDVLRLARWLDAGRLDLFHYRGRSCFPFAVQAAEHFIRHALQLVHVADVGEADVARDEGGLVATFEVPDGVATARVSIDVVAEPQRLTCKAERTHRPLRFELLSLSRSVAPGTIDAESRPAGNVP